MRIIKVDTKSCEVEVDHVYNYCLKDTKNVLELYKNLDLPKDDVEVTEVVSETSI